METIKAIHKIAYAAPAFALAVVGIPVYVYVPKFYTDVVGVHIGALGAIILAVRICDALTDPLLGFLSDRSTTRFGRRRPYIALGSIALALFIYLLFNPPAGGRDFETWWFGLCVFFLFLFWTVVQVPYEALGPEITFDYDERTALFSIRDGALILGTLAAASSPALVRWAFDLPVSAAGERLTFFWISALYAPLVILFCWWCAFAIQEKPRSEPWGGLGGTLWQRLRDISRNRPFRILVLSYTIAAFGSNLPATLILYYVQYVLESQHADLFLLLYFVTGIVFLPGWIKLAKKFEKKSTWIGSMLVNTGAFIGVFFLGPGDAWLYGILVFFSGIGFGATLAIPSAMQADVIDYDELLTGERREGQYVGLWAIAKKLSAALGIGLALAILGSSGYAPNVEQNEQVRWTLRVLYALTPSVCNLVAIAIAFAYPIDRATHQAIRAAIMKRGSAGATGGPPPPG